MCEHLGAGYLRSVGGGRQVRQRDGGIRAGVWLRPTGHRGIWKLEVGGVFIYTHLPLYRQEN